MANVVKRYSISSELGDDSYLVLKSPHRLVLDFLAIFIRHHSSFVCGCRGFRS
jgi:hypothetical protein